MHEFSADEKADGAVTEKNIKYKRKKLKQTNASAQSRSPVRM